MLLILKYDHDISEEAESFSRPFACASHSAHAYDSYL